MAKSGPDRITKQLLAVLRVLYDAHAGGGPIHGWAIMKATRHPRWPLLRLTGPTVYGVLDRLEDWGWVEAQWESPEALRGYPRRRLYNLTSTGVQEAEHLLTERHASP